MKISGLTRSINRMKKRADAFSGRNPKIYEGISSDVAASINRNFNAQGRPKWQKRKGDYSHPILDLTGATRDSAETSAVRWYFQGNEYTIRILSTEYGQFHQYGCGNLPIRAFILFQTAELAKMRSRFTKAFHKP